LVDSFESRGSVTAGFRSIRYKQNSATCYMVNVMQEKSDYIAIN
jgi:hypothetical protein